MGRMVRKENLEPRVPPAKKESAGREGNMVLLGLQV